MIFQGKFSELLPPLSTFPRLMINDGVSFKGQRHNQRCIFLLTPEEASKLNGVKPGTEIEVDAPGLPPSPDMPLFANHVNIGWRPENM